MSHQGNDSYNEQLEIIEKDLADALEEREKAIEEISQAIKWYERMNAKVNLEKIHLSTLKSQI